jgi:hypothetical protein
MHLPAAQFRESPADGVMQIESYRNRLEAFERSLNHELYLWNSGDKNRLELVSLYSDYSDLFCIESIREIESELKSESFDSRRKSLEKIQLFLIDQYLDYKTAPVTEEIQRFASTQTIQWEGRVIPISQVSAKLRWEPNAPRRQQCHERYASALAEGGELKRRKVQQLGCAARDLGFDNYVMARERISGILYEELLAPLEEAMNRLNDKFQERFRLSFETTVGIPFREAGIWDVPHWEEKNDRPDVFRKQDLLRIADLTCAELGIRPKNSEVVFLHLEPAIGKRATPLCIPVRVPQEIKIVMVPEDGSRHYGCLLHEYGHAYHFAWTSPSLPAEHRLLGDRGLCEAYAFLLEHFVQECEWLTRMLLFTKSELFLRFRALFRVYLIRSCIGKLRFTLKLHASESIDDVLQTFPEIMKAYTGLEFAPECWTSENGFASADHLRGWIFEAMLREYLRTKYGNAWTSNRSASGFLKEIWETGMLYSADELCNEIGMGSLDPQVLADHLWEGLRY